MTASLSYLSPHFSWDEVTRSPTAERLHIHNDLPSTLIENVRFTAAGAERARAILGVPMIVHSWYRCPELNAAIGGVKTSKHMEGLAIDFDADGMELLKAFNLLASTTVSQLDFDQLIIEGTRDGAHWIHLGFAWNKPRREVLRAHGDKLGGPMVYERVAIG